MEIAVVFLLPVSLVCASCNVLIYTHFQNALLCIVDKNDLRMVSFGLKGLGFCRVLSMSLFCMPFTFIQGLVICEAAVYE